MDPQNQQSGEVVTIKEAVTKVKQWFADKDYEKAKQGCNEILEAEPDNAEVKKLLEEINAAESGLEAKPTTEEAPEAPAAPAAPEAPSATEAPTAPEMPETPEVTPAVETAGEQPPSVPMVEEEAAPAPETTPEPAAEEPAPTAPEGTPATTEPEAQTPADIFKKPETPEIKPEEAAGEEASQPVVAEEKPKKKGMLGKIIIVVVLLAIIAGLVYSYIQGWLNPIFEQILSLLGL